ncbi:hypothetical protein [Mesorhizobium sp. M0698]|uniref:hypothetical protein n=1 Tax=Mesorhizobium sp. M0698 TaxID=2956987 RepID=UPI00333D5519
METSFKNELLRRLSAPDLTLLQPHLEARHLGLRTHLEQTSVPIDTVDFFESGLGSMVAKLRAEVEAEVGLIGFDGMTGAALVMGEDRSPHDCFVQLKAEAIAIDARWRIVLMGSPRRNTSD